MLNIGLFPNIEKRSASGVLNRIVRFYEDKGAQLFMPAEEAHNFGYEQHTNVTIMADLGAYPLDMALSIGGDGTLLGVCRRLYPRHIPICGINIGTFGFLADIEPLEMESKLEKILKGQYYLEERMMLAGHLKSADDPLGEGKQRFLCNAINDVVVRSISRMLHLGVFINGYHVMDYKADGLIVSTATGSTAYSMSAGGPLINPKVRVLLLTPICPHTFNARPIVIAENDEVRVLIGATHQDIVVTFDGQESFTLTPDDEILVRKADYAAQIVKFDDKDFYQVIRTKLLYNVV